MTERSPRLRPLDPRAVDRAAAVGEGAADAELLERLEEALAALPADERAAAVVAYGLAEGSAGVASELGLSGEDAEALARSALQLLRGALADLEPADDQIHPRLHRRAHRPSHTKAPD